MDRRPEPEIMDGKAQTRAYAEADFSQAHDHFVELFKEIFSDVVLSGFGLDLGCGPADVTLRFARAFPQLTIHGVDASQAMLSLGQQAVERAGLTERIRLFCCHLPADRLPLPQYDAVISNSLLHHLCDPRVLWDTVRRFGRSGAPIFVMDLLRPSSSVEAEQLTETYAAQEPDVLQRDFFNSLLAAYRVAEVRVQLAQAGLHHFSVRVVSDRHWLAYGLAR